MGRVRVQSFAFWAFSSSCSSILLLRFFDLMSAGLRMSIGASVGGSAVAGSSKRFRKAPRPVYAGIFRTVMGSKYSSGGRGANNSRSFGCKNLVILLDLYVFARLCGDQQKRKDWRVHLRIDSLLMPSPGPLSASNWDDLRMEHLSIFKTCAFYTNTWGL